MKLSTHGFSVDSQLKHLFMQRYERYLPTAFDESMSLLEKMNKLIEAQNKLIDVVNSHTEYTNEQLFKAFGIIDRNLNSQLENFQEVLENNLDEMNTLKEYVENSQLPDTVEEKLETWLLDGTIIDLVTGSVFPEMVERIEILENRINAIPKSVLDFGAVGDGVADDTQAFKEAGLSGESVSIPQGEYIITDTIYMENNTEFIGDGYNSKILNPSHSKFVLFRGQGSFGDEHPITQNEGIGSTKVSVNNPTDFKVGDDVRIMSQRDAMHRGDTGQFWMGVQTSSSDRVYLGEIKTLISVENNDLNFFGGLIFPDYNTHKNNEQSSNARSNTTVQKVNFKENLKVANLSVHGGFLSPVRFYICKNSVVDNIVWEDARDGELVFIQESFNCEVRNSSVHYNTTIRPNNYYSRNSLKTVSSYLCGFKNCTVVNGTQSVDFTYFKGPTLMDMDSYVIGCNIIGSERHGATAHGGTYRSVFKDNKFVDCHVDGIMSRANQAVITGNTVSGPGNSDGNRTYGIRLNQGASINALISHNKVSGFAGGIGTIAGSGADFDYVGAVITDNVVTGVNHAFEFRGPNTPINRRAHILLENNLASEFVGSSGRFVLIYEYFRDIKIRNNTFIGNDSVGRGISSLGNVFDLEVTGNTLWNAGVGIDLGDVTSDVFNTTRYPIIWNNNKTTLNQNVAGRMSGAIGNLIFDRNYTFGSLYPYQPETVNIGYTDNRWKGVYLMENPNVASDKRLKENIVPLEKASEIIKQLNPVSYNLKNNGDKTFGLIAQDVEKVINEGVVSKPKNDDDYYGMNYEALIPLIIKSLQELMDK